MDTFKVYLPSNACENIYPSNTASKFETVLSRPISLQGEWEVAAESIFYSPPSLVKNESITARVAYDNIKYHLTKENRWKGFDGIYPLDKTLNTNNIDKVITTLNGMNQLISKEEKELFTFAAIPTDNPNVYHVTFTCSIPSLTLMLTPTLTKYLGFSDDIYFSSDIKTTFTKPTTKKEVKATAATEEVKATSATELMETTPLTEEDERKAIARLQSFLSTPLDVQIRRIALKKKTKEDIEKVIKQLPSFLTAPLLGKKVTKEDIDKAIKLLPTYLITPLYQHLLEESKATNNETNEEKKLTIEEKKLTNADFHIRYLDTAYLKHEKFLIKPEGHNFYNDRYTSRIKHKWYYTVQQVFDCRVAFDKKDHLVLFKNKNDSAFIFNKTMSDALQIDNLMIGAGQIVAKKDINKTMTYAEFGIDGNKLNNDEWFVDAYYPLPLNEEQCCLNINYEHVIDYDDTIHQLISSINRKMETVIKESTGFKYDKQRHKFQLTIENSHVKLMLGKYLQTLTVSENLSYILGFKERILATLTTKPIAIQPVSYSNIDSMHLLIKTSLITSTAYGNQHIPFIQSFISQDWQQNVVEKRFNPLVYYPLRTNYITNITINIVNDKDETVKIDDSKTLVVLYFRKVNHV